MPALRSVSGIIRRRSVGSGEGSDGLEGQVLVTCPVGGWGLIRLSPLQQPQSQTQITIHPGADRHGPSGVVEALSPVPLEDIRIRLVTVAGQTCRDTVFGNAQSTSAARKDMINGFGRFAAINTTLTGVSMERLSPTSDA